MSKVILPFSVHKLDFIEFFDSLIPNVLFKGGQNVNLPFELIISKKQISDLNVESKLVHLSISVEIEAKKGKIYSKGILLLAIDIEIIFDNANLIRTKTKLNSFNWEEKPQLNISFIKIPITLLVEEYIKSQNVKWFEKIDQYIFDERLINKYHDKFIDTVNQPITIEKDVLLLQTKLDTIMVSNFKSDNNYFFGELCVEFDNRLLKSTDYEKVNNQNPQLSWSEKSLSKEKINLRLDVEKDMVQFVTEYFYQKFLNGKTVSIQGKEVQVLDLKGYTDRDSFLVFEVKYSGNLRGTTELIFTPRWSYDDKKIELKNHDLKIEPNDFLSKVALFFVDEKIKKKVIFEIEKVLNEKINLEINNYIEKLNKKDIRNKITLINYDLPVSITENRLTIEFFASIEALIFVNNIKIYLGKFLENVKTGLEE